ncbi:hypothetical protein BDP27DRAFT_1458158 [Rhodocollybia butyracea]|uniref:Uncharacterized protein n=1 Tax=Rhodocollybia butyracea TaxID=206335 RepID=A0A9P5NZZ4_9AGAR|nr:hypothetical protein BDP27DRAFT_1458158 [Rhodocollybia butyracea]
MASDSESEEDIQLDDSDLPEITLPEGNPTMFTVKQALSNVQLQNQEFRNRNEILRAKVANLQTKLMLTKKTKGGGRRGQEKVDPQILEFGKSFTVLRDPWLDPASFAAIPTGADRPSPSDCMKTFGTYQDSVIYELKDHLARGGDELYFRATNDPDFKREFIKQVNSQRSTSLSVIRSHAAVIFAGLDVPVLLWAAKAGPERGMSDLCQKLLKFQNRKSSFSPIHFQNHTYQITGLFLNEYQPRILRAILLGPQSVQKIDPSHAQASTVLRSTSLAMSWQVRQINASCIAFSAVLLQFLVSPDLTLSLQGAVSKIKYRENFFAFKKYIVDSQGTAWADLLFSFYNTRVFAGVDFALHVHHSEALTVNTESGAVDEINQMLNELRLDGASGHLDWDIPPDPISVNSSTPSTTGAVTTRYSDMSRQVELGAANVSVHTQSNLVDSDVPAPAQMGLDPHALEPLTPDHSTPAIDATAVVQAEHLVAPAARGSRGRRAQAQSRAAPPRGARTNMDEGAPQGAQVARVTRNRR